jgi:hypothetical protein
MSRRGLTVLAAAERLRKLATLAMMATVIGTGVFVKARVMTCNVGSPGAVETPTTETLV